MLKNLSFLPHVTVINGQDVDLTPSARLTMGVGAQGFFVMSLWACEQKTETPCTILSLNSTTAFSSTMT